MRCFATPLAMSCRLCRSIP